MNRTQAGAGEVGDGARSWLPGLSDLGPEVGSSPDIDGVEEAGASPAVGLITKSFPVLLSEK